MDARNNNIIAFTRPSLTAEQLFALLRSKGYTERQLNLEAKEGMIENTIRKAINTVNDTSYGTEASERFRITVPGRFERNLDYLSFVFDFRLNPERNTLQVVAMTAAMDGLKDKKLYLIVNPEQLVTPIESHKDLAAIREKRATEILFKMHRQPVKRQTLHL